MLILLFSFKVWALIDMKNANYSQSFVDVDLKGNSFDLRIVRTYNSRSLHEGYFGFGWCSNIETRLKISGKTLLVQECGAGQQTEYVLDVSGGGQKIFKSVSGPDFIIEEKGVFTKKHPDGTIQKFNQKGQLIGIADRNGNFIKIEWQNDLPRFIQDNLGRRLTLQFGENRKVKQIVGPNNLRVNYTYDKMVNLIEVKNAWGNTYQYVYDDLHNLTKAIYPDGSFVELTYDKEKDWVTSYRDRNGCVESYKYDFSKTEPHLHYWASVQKKCGQQIVSEAKHEFWFKPGGNNQVWLWKVLTIVNGRSIEIVYHPVWKKPITIRKDNDLMQFEYDSQGFVISKISKWIKVQYEYDKKIQKVKKVRWVQFDSKGKEVLNRVIEFDYDNKLNLVKAQSSDGKVVMLDYDEKGRMVRLKDQAKRVVELKYNEKYSKPSEVIRPQVGKVIITYDKDGAIQKVQSPQGPTVALQISSLFNNLLDLLAPVTNEIYN